MRSIIFITAILELGVQHNMNIIWLIVALIEWISLPYSLSNKKVEVQTGITYKLMIFKFGKSI